MRIGAIVQYLDSIAIHAANDRATGIGTKIAAAHTGNSVQCFSNGAFHLQQ